MRVIISNMVWLPKKELDEVKLYQLKKSLTLLPKRSGYEKPDDLPKIVEVYRETEEHIGIPRHYYLLNKKAAHQEIFQVSQGQPILAMAPIMLKPEQEQVAQAVLDNFKEKPFAGGLIDAYVAFGKTVTGMEIARRLGGNTMILVHKKPLMNNWMEEIRKFFPEARIGMVQGDTCDYEDKDFVVGMCQSMMNENGDKYPQNLYRHFRTVVIDECLDASTMISVPGPAVMLPIKSIKVGMEVVTPTGVARVKDVWIRENKPTYRYVTESGREIIASKNHIVVSLDKDGNRVQQAIGDSRFLLNTWDEFEEIVDAKYIDSRDLYDIELDDENRLFIANGFVVHNCHRFGAAAFATVVPRFSAKYLLGVSGTVRRKDGCENAFKWVLGDVIAKPANEDNRLKPFVYVRYTGFNPERRHYKDNKTGETKVFDINQYPKPTQLNIIARSYARNELIAKDIVKAVQAGRNPLVMAERLELLDKVSSIVAKMFNDINPDAKLTQGFYIGGKKKEDLLEASECDVVYSTLQLAQEGVNIPRLDTLFMTTPVGDCEQVMGRITRHQEGKKDPMVVDYVDSDIRNLGGMFKTRMRLYKRLGFKVIGMKV